MHTTKITQTLALAGFAPAGKLSHLYCGLLPVLALFVARLGKLSRGKRAYAVLVLCAATAIALPAQTFTRLSSFDSTDGANPWGLVQGTDGNFYGMTSEGGVNCSPHGCGTVFKITSGGVLTTLYSFCAQTGCTDGAGPSAGLVQATNGDFYGTTGYGGAYCASTGGCGTIFEITPSGTLTTLYNFCSQGVYPYCTDGEEPLAGLVQATNGNFYGTTLGGANGYGTVFKITPSGTLTTLHSFDGTDGVGPRGLLQATNGDFYGPTIEYGKGVIYGGTIFRITPSGTLTTLHRFCTQSSACTDGSFPQGSLVQGTDGNFYGMTSEGGVNCSPYGCGTVFKITSGGVLTTLYSFCSQPDCTDGSAPEAGLIQATDGNLYGTTDDGGANGDGTVFNITLSGTLTTLHSFDGTDGNGPAAPLVQDTNGNLYGTASGGGAGLTTCCGTVFSLSVGLGPFVETQPTFGEVGEVRKILGNDLTGATSVSFDGTAAAFTVIAPSLITATVPAGASTGTVQVVTPSGTLSSNVPFRVLP
jgi:uncharacterized repeat protein (TIGR03803 family)